MNMWILDATTSAYDAVKEVLRLKAELWSEISDAAMWADILLAGMRILLIFILTRIIIKVVYKVIDRSLERKTGGRLLSNTRRLTTVGELLKNIVTFICNFVMIMIILSEFNFDLAPLLAGAGVLGLAVGFGAQSLVKDVITGFFIILEDQFAVGDVIQTGTYKGTVELIGLRTTRLLSTTGEVFIIPNGLITNVTNYSLSNALAVVDVPVKMEQSLEATLALIGEALKGIEQRNSNVLAYPNVLGIQSMSTSEYVIRIAATCLPNGRDAAERQIQSDIKQAIEKQSRIEQALAEEEARIQAETEDSLQAEAEARSSEAGMKRQVAATQEENKGED